MFNLSSICCVCLADHKTLRKLFDSDNEGVNNFQKLTLIIPEMYFEGMNDQRLLCTICCEKIDSFHKFREKCLETKNILLSQLHAKDVLNNTQDFIDIHSMKLAGCSTLQNENINNTEIKVETDGSSNCEENNGENGSDTPIDCYKNNGTENETSQSSNISTEEVIIKMETNYEEFEDENTTSTSEDLQEGSSSEISNTDPNAIQKEFACTRCDQVFTRPYHLKKHRKVHRTDEVLHECKFCHKKYVSEKTLLEHVRAHNGENPHSCNICGKKFNGFTNLISHKRTHSGEKPFECNVCGKKFSQEGNLMQHFRKHIGDQPFDCKLCSMKFMFASHLKTHMKIHEEKEKPPQLPENPEENQPKYDTKMTYNEETRCYECNICNETFTKIPLLTQHMLEHSGNVPYACSICNSQYNDVSLLRAHMKNMHEYVIGYERIIVKPDLPKEKIFKHSRLYSYECHICGLIFNKIPQLTQHMTVHSGQNPYQCSLCNSKYNDITLLKQHMKTCDQTHTYLPEKGLANKCAYCNESFNDAGAFAEHLKVHKEHIELKGKDLHRKDNVEKIEQLIVIPEYLHKNNEIIKLEKNHMQNKSKVKIE